MTASSGSGDGSWFPLGDRNVVAAAVSSSRSGVVRHDAGGTAARRQTARPGVGTIARAIAASIAAHPGVRRTFRAGIVVVAVAAALGCSLGVIMLDNVVIHRSAELGKLDQDRKRLRTENALLAASIAQLSAPPRVVMRARRRLGMAEGPMPRFVFLDPSNRPIRSRRARAAATQAAGGAPTTARRPVRVPRATSTVPVPAAAPATTRRAAPRAVRQASGGSQ